MIKSKEIFENDAQTRWFKMGEEENYISHNHIRDVFEDSDSIIWVATDYGLNRYDNQRKRFIRYSIFSPDKMRNANWTYDILEDSLNRLWIASFKDGIFVIDKEKLLQPGTSFIADNLYSKQNGLSGNNVDFMVFDRDGNIWALIHHTTLDVINIRTGEVVNFPINNYTNHVPTFLMSDTEGDIWVGFRNGVLCISEKNKVHTIQLKGANHADILSMIELDNSIWACTTEVIWMIDKSTYEARRIAQSNQVFTGMYYDNDTKSLILGGTNRIKGLSGTKT